MLYRKVLRENNFWINKQFIFRICEVRRVFNKPFPSQSLKLDMLVIKIDLYMYIRQAITLINKWKCNPKTYNNFLL